MKRKCERFNSFDPYFGKIFTNISKIVKILFYKIMNPNINSIFSEYDSVVYLVRILDLVEDFMTCKHVNDK